jgi:hypothetical protein
MTKTLNLVAPETLGGISDAHSPCCAGTRPSRISARAAKASVSGVMKHILLFSSRSAAGHLQGQGTLTAPQRGRRRLSGADFIKSDVGAAQRVEDPRQESSMRARRQGAASSRLWRRRAAARCRQTGARGAHPPALGGGLPLWTAARGPSGCEAACWAAGPALLILHLARDELPADALRSSVALLCAAAAQLASTLCVGRVRRSARRASRLAVTRRRAASSSLAALAYLPPFLPPPIRAWPATLGCLVPAWLVPWLHRASRLADSACTRTPLASRLAAL